MLIGVTVAPWRAMMEQTTAPLKIRLEPELRRWLEEVAKANRRSMHAEINFRLGVDRAEAGRPLGGAPAAGEASQA